jgi:hypothetical protein
MRLKRATRFALVHEPQNNLNLIGVDNSRPAMAAIPLGCHASGISNERT